MKFDRKKFFPCYRSKFGSLSQSQADGLGFLLDKIEDDDKWQSVSQIAYFLATIKHETANSFQPIKEKRERATSPRRANQDRYWLTGEYGRGYVQITWDRNYRKFGLNPDERDKALEPDTAYMIAARGMREGLFTGKKLSDYTDLNPPDYRNARKIINGLDRADEIAEIANKLRNCLYGALLDATDKKEDIQKLKPDPAQNDPETQKAVDQIIETSPKLEEIPTNEPVVVEGKKVSLFTKIAAAAAPVTAALGGAGLKIGGIQFSPTVLIVFFVMITVGMIVGAWLYNEGKKRALQSTLKMSDAAVDKNKFNLVIK